MLIIERLGSTRGALGPGDPITLGVDQIGALPPVIEGAFDVLLTTAANASPPWVTSADVDADIAALTQAIHANAAPAAVLAGVLRSSVRASFTAALQLESLAYSRLLASEDFMRWRLNTPIRKAAPPSGELVRLERDGDVLLIRLDDPTSRNALSPVMRDCLLEALTLPELDQTIRGVIITGAGPIFSSGGHLDDFGTSQDVAAAHQLRVSHSPAAAIHRLAGRVTVRVQGAAIGSGLELAAAAGRLEAHGDAVFRLPELAMGLIPGAGGTASLPRRIGRHRTAYMVLTGQNIDARTALDWGLIDALVQAP